MPGDEAAAAGAVAGSVRRRLYGGSAWWMGGQAVALGLGLVRNVLVAHLVSPRDAGTFFLATSFTDLGVIFVQVGVSVVMMRIIAESMATGAFAGARAAVNLGVRATTVVAVFVAGVLALPVASRVAAGLFPSSRIGAVTTFVGATIAVRALAQVIASAFRGFSEFARSAVIAIVAGPALATAGVTVLWIISGRASLSVVVAIVAAGWVPAVVVGYALIRRRVAALPEGKPADRPTDYRTIGRVALPILAAGVAGYFQRQAAFWIVGSRLSSGDIARFGAAVKLAGILALPVAIVGAVAAPVIAESRALGRHDQLERVVRLMSTLGSLPSIAALVAFGVAGGPILSILFGPYYGKAAPILMLLSVGQVFNVVTGLNEVTLMMTGHERWVLVATLLGLLTVVVVSFATIGPLGPLGPAIGVAAGYVTMNTFTWIAARLLLGVWTHAGVGPLVVEWRELASMRRR